VEPLVRAEVLHQLLRRHDRLGLEGHAGRRDADQGPQRAQDQVHLGLVLAVGALALPQERRRIQPEDVDAVVGQREHGVEHRGEDLDVGPVQVPLEAVEGRPHPPDAVDVGEAAGGVVGEHLGQGALVAVRLGAVGEDPVEGPVRRVAGRRGERPRVLRGGVVEHQVDAQGHAAVVQVGRQLLQVGHGAQPGVDRVVVDHGVAAVVVPLARCQQGHQVQVGDAELGQVVQPLPHSRQVAGEPVGVGDVADHPGPLEPAGVDLAAPVQGAQRDRPVDRGGDDPVDQAPRKIGQRDVVGRVQPVQRHEQVQVVLLEAGHQALALDRTERVDGAGAHPGQQRVEDGPGPGPGFGTRGLVRHHRRS
jgi:hypothetical protein